MMYTKMSLKLGVLSIVIYTLGLTCVVGFTESARSDDTHVRLKRKTSNTATSFTEDKYRAFVPENQVALHFQRDRYTANVREDIDIGTHVLTVHALRADSGQNSELEYSIIGGAASSFPFAIDAHKGQIFVQRLLDRETQDHFSFTVQVTDPGFLHLTAATSIEITVLDINDNAPIFTRFWNISVPEDSPINLEVVQVSAVDADTGLNALITYTIISGNNDKTFSIGSKTGIVTLENHLDYTIQSNFTLRVDATDGSFKTRTTVFIHVIEMNNHAPSFQRKTFRFNVSEFADIGTSVGIVRAIDNDDGNNGRINYEILTGTRAFNIDTNTGVIRTQTFLDHESVSAYSLEVRATDNGNHKLQDTTGVIVSVQDENDNAPVFMKTVYEAVIRKPVTRGEFVTTVHAVDADFGLNSQVRYHWSSVHTNTIMNSLLIDQMNGTIYIANSKTINTEPVGNYTLRIEAVDRGVPPTSAMAEVRIKVEESVIPVG